MNTLKRITSLALLLMLCLGVFSLTAEASSVMEYNGLEVVVEMDKEVYSNGEPITATITVTNSGTQSVTIANLEQLIPEGYELAADSDAYKRNVTLKPGDTLVLEVTYGADEDAGEDNADNWSVFDTILYGESVGIPNLFIAVIVVVGVALFLFLT